MKVARSSRLSRTSTPPQTRERREDGRFERATTSSRSRPGTIHIDRYHHGSSFPFDSVTRPGVSRCGPIDRLIRSIGTTGRTALASGGRTST